MQKAYNHQSSEEKIYENWEDSGDMRADVNSSKKAFTIPLPPPNVTGQLHLGHAAMLAIEDIMIRYKKMTGHESLWIPGTDHAAIATENVVLKHLGAKSREEYSREEFLGHCREFASDKHDIIINQMKKMGAWLDWSREAYTFDDERNFAVNKIFKQLYEDGLIVRGHRLINWSVGAQSVLADDEVEWEERKEPFYYIRCGEFIMGTVRSETKCADSPVVVHPEGEYVRTKFTDKKGKSEIFILSKNLFEDEAKRSKMLNLLDTEGTWEALEAKKGKDLVGQEFEYETYAGKRKFYVLADEVIDMEKGTGAMTISCNHSADDYDLGKRLGLDNYFFDKIDFEGNMKAISGSCEGMTIAEARKESAKIMKEKGLLVGEEKDYSHRTPLCYRSGCVVEPMVSPQWFVAVEKEYTCKFTGEKTTLKKLTQEAVRNKQVKIIPEKFEKIYFQWIDNLHDWCISRQIWWGHQIPVWYDKDDKIHLGKEQKFIFARHGETTAGQNKIVQGKEDSLSESGMVHAETLAKEVKEKNITRIISSDHARAKETAEIVAKKLGLEIEIWKEFGGIDFGTITEEPVIKGKMALERSMEKETGETTQEVFDRVKKGWEKLRKESTEGKILVVSHRSILSALETVRAGRTVDEFLKTRQRKEGAKFGVWGEVSAFQEPDVKKSLICVKHGEIASSKKNGGDVIIPLSNIPSLTETGKDQAKEVAELLKKRKISKIICSDLKETKETAEIIKKELGLNIAVEPWTDFDGFSYSEKFAGKIIEKGPLVEEKRKELFKRAKPVYEKLKEIKTTGDVLLVANDTLLSLLFANKKELSFKDFLIYLRRDWDVKLRKETTFEEILLSKKGTLRQDEDTLDTWFSSALWPFSTVGWPNENDPEFQKFYPNDVLETGHDILFFWVARMIMFGRYATGKYPFHTVYLHGLVTDEKGKKMSKSKGNGIDPLTMIEKFGADPVRLALVIGSTPGQKIPIGEAKISGYRNFVNKLWNAGRFVQMQLEQHDLNISDKKAEPKSLVDKWIAHRFEEVEKEVRKNLEAYNMSKAGEAIYHFVWDEFCDWYLEAQKVAPNPQFLTWLYLEILKLIHPLCPFVTEEIYTLFEGNDKSLMNEVFPDFDFQDEKSASLFTTIQQIVTEIRKVRADKKLNPKDKISAKINSAKPELKENEAIIKSLANLSEVEFGENLEKPERSATVLVEGIEIFIEIPFDANAEKVRLEKEKSQLEKQISGLKSRLSKKSYIDKAPEHLVNQTKEQLKKANADLTKIETSLKEL